VTAKGKGVLNTFWCNPSARKGSTSSTASSETSSTDHDMFLFESTLGTKGTPEEAIVKQGRLVEWMVKLLLEHVKKIVSSSLLTRSLSCIRQP
jgi:hypothetical protein